MNWKQLDPEKRVSQSTGVCMGKDNPAWPQCYMPPLRTAAGDICIMMYAECQEKELDTHTD